jgi:DNA-binding GntR family transcriptional regulator
MSEMAALVDERTIVSLRQINENMQRCAHEPSLFLAENQLFHFTIYRASNNPVVLPMIESLWMQIGPVLNLVTTELGIKAATHHHSEIISNLEKKDPKGARRALEADINDAAATILAYMQPSKDFKKNEDSSLVRV